MIDRASLKLKYFYKDMLFYALIFILITFIIWGLFYRYISAYEQAQPKTAITSYLEDLDDAHIAKITSPLASQYVNDLQDEETCQKVLNEEFHKEITYAKDILNSDEHTVVYILNNGNDFGKITFHKEDDSKFSFSSWQLEKEEYSFDYLIQSKTITIPNDYQVSFSEELPADSISIKNIDYDMFKAFSSDYSFPYQIQYRIKNYLGEISFSIQDAQGNPVNPEDFDAKKLLDNCSKETKQSLSNFFEAFLPLYIQCLSNSNHNAQRNYENISPYILKDSDLIQRIREAIADQVWAPGLGDELGTITYNAYTDLNNGDYFLDVTYELISNSATGSEKYENNAKLILRKSGNSYVVCDIASY